jgi:hypothetical protein
MQNGEARPGGSCDPAGLLGGLPPAEDRDVSDDRACVILHFAFCILHWVEVWGKCCTVTSLVSARA